MRPVSGTGSSMSALKAFGDKTQVTAHNVANVNTDEFKKNRADLVEDAQGGVKVEISKPGSREKGNFQAEKNQLQTDAKKEPKELSNVDIAEEMVNSMTTEKFYSANTKMVQAEDDMKGTVIDMVS